MIIKLNSEWVESISGYPPEVRLEVYEAVINYVVSGTLPNLKPMSAGAFAFIKKEIDKAKNISAKRAMAGKIGAEKRICLSKSEQNLAKSSKISGDLSIVNTNSSSLIEKEENTKKEIPKKETEKKKDPRTEFVDNLPEVWRDLVRYWLKYKTERRETYKTVQSLKVFYNHLQSYSQGSPDIARKILEQSMGNNWAGIFELKNTSAPTKQTRVDAPKEGTNYKEYYKTGSSFVI